MRSWKRRIKDEPFTRPLVLAVRACWLSVLVEREKWLALSQHFLKSSPAKPLEHKTQTLDTTNTLVFEGSSVRVSAF